MPKIILLTVLFWCHKYMQSFVNTVSSSLRTSFIWWLFFPLCFPTCDDITLPHGCDIFLFFLYMKILNIQGAKLPLLMLNSTA